MDPGLRVHSFNSADSMWLRMERQNSTTLIAGLALFDQPITFARLREQMSERLLRFDRFVSGAARGGLPVLLPVWDPARHFDLDGHLHCTVLPDPGGWPQLQALIQSMLAAPLPHAHPMWQMHLIERFGEGSAVVMVLEHTIADGIAWMYLVGCMTDPEPDARRFSGPVPAPAGARPAVLTAGARQPPARPGVVGKAVYGLQMAKALAKYLTMRPDRKTVLQAKPSHARRVAACEPVPIAEIKALGRPFGATLNDVIATVVAGAFRRYLAGRGQAVDDLTLHASVPYNLRTVEQTHHLGNIFGIVFLPLPIYIADPAQRLPVVKRHMDYIKSHPEAPTTQLIMKAAGLMPPPLCKLATQLFMNKVSAVLTNVPGSSDIRYLAGTRLGRVMFWVPTPCLRSLGVSVLSYAGQVNVCFNSDAAAVPDLDVMVAAYEAELDELRAQVTARQAAAQPSASAVATPVAVKSPEPTSAIRPTEPALESARAPAAADGSLSVPPLPATFAPLPEGCLCQAIAESGQPCPNEALPGSDYCRQHAGLAIAACQETGTGRPVS